ncbi:dolichyl-diphosphooligosaccharide--protein glycosyltransferase subunit DAD1-like isoform X1 [Carica papaya]|uniref:dolichyl-diphosphooligosaccharide--protein glycosyltransferase subunit DAD1-like isoform X1 n=1 Tax=Carica papaya TaxID=3649 RepID=UPI000B8CCF4B|nr:dolichyl-diphosphooligosaccharide--protein glycosyltransferase subunit DAD1-like isoform X1 [Carica papaya]
MARSTGKDARALFHSLLSAYAATPTNLKVIDLYVGFAVFTALIQVVYMAIVGSFPFNSFLSGVLSCVGTAVLAVCLRIQVNKENKEFKDLPPERAFADFVLCNLADLRGNSNTELFFGLYELVPHCMNQIYKFVSKF